MINEIKDADKDVDDEGNLLYYKVTGIRILKPIIVQPAGNGQHEILDGHYRVAAARKLKSDWKLDSVKIPAIIKSGLTYKEALDYVLETNPIGLLLKCDIDILCNDYRQTEGYKRQADSLIFIYESRAITMAMDEFIEHFLLDKYNVYDLYKSIYSMGNPYELTEEECADVAVASEISRMEYKESEGIVEDLINKFT